VGKESSIVLVCISVKGRNFKIKFGKQSELYSNEKKLFTVYLMLYKIKLTAKLQS